MCGEFIVNVKILIYLFAHQAICETNRDLGIKVGGGRLWWQCAIGLIVQVRFEYRSKAFRIRHRAIQISASSILLMGVVHILKLKRGSVKLFAL